MQFKVQLKSFIFFMACFVIAIWGLKAHAAEEDQSFKEIFVDSNISISNWFDSVAEGVDLFVMGETVSKERNETNVKLSNTSYLVEGKGYTNETSLSVNPRFPNFEKYWNLKFTTYDEQEDRGADKNYLRQTPRQKNYGASIGLFRKLGDVRVVFQPRIELQDPLKVSHSLAFESIADMKTYKINPKLEFFANATTGPGIFEALNFNFILSRYYSLTLINEGTYDDKTHLYSVTNGVSVGQSLSERGSMTYSFLFFSKNQSNYHLNGYSIAASWYHLIYKKVLDFQLTPHLDFSEETDFRGLSGLTFQITINF
jgi:hypothetical protein